MCYSILIVVWITFHSNKKNRGKDSVILINELQVKVIFFKNTFISLIILTTIILTNVQSKLLPNIAKTVKENNYMRGATFGQPTEFF